MRERMRHRITLCLPAWVLLLAGLFSLGGEAWSQDGTEPRPVARASVAVEFLPPPLDGATYSLGIYDLKSGKLIRHLHEIAPESAFTVGTNGLVTGWDGKDDSGQKAPPGRYAAHGYAVGPMKVEGTQILGNDWASNDETLRVTHVEAIAYLPPDGGVAVLATMTDGSMALLSLSAEGKLLWRRALPGLTADCLPKLQVRDERVFVVAKAPLGGAGTTLGGTFRANDGTPDPLPPDVRKDYKTGPPTWSAGLEGLRQIAVDGTVLRKLDLAPGEPVPFAVSASDEGDRLYLLEEKKGWQRLRGLSWVETKEEGGQPVSTWQTFFERNIRTPDPALGLEVPAVPVRISLIGNPLEPGKLQKIDLGAAFDDKGSYLTTADGLRLRQISQQPHLRAAKLEKGKREDTLTFFQADAAAWDEFSIAGTRNMMAFDAGEFELTAAGEKPVTEKAPEPDL